MIKFAAWNVRGLNDPVKQAEVRHLVQSQALSCVALLETKVQQSNQSAISLSLMRGWRFIDNFSCHPLGRIWLWWNPLHLDVSLLSSHSQFLHVSVSMVDSGLAFYLSVVYGTNAVEGRRQLWDSLTGLAPVAPSMPWVVMGDFNAIRFRGDRCGGSLAWPGFMDDFNEAILRARLDDLRYIGLFFTWHNCRSGGHIRRKLDRVLVNSEWLQTFPHAFAEFLPFGVSDHSPAVVHVGVQSPGVRSPFKFFNHWASFDDFLPTVEAVWQTPVAGYAMFRLYARLKLLKRALKELCQRQHRVNSLDSFRSALSRIQVDIATNGGDAASLAQEREALHHLSSASRWVEESARQKSRIQWLREGDCNTSFFFNSVKSRQNRNKIRAICSGDGSWLYDPGEIASSGVQFFSSLLGSAGDLVSSGHSLRDFIGPSLSADLISELQAPFSSADIQASMFSLHPNKAPGPDGFNGFFFQQTWHIVGPDVVQAVQEFFSSSVLLKASNATILALIPKIPNAAHWKDFRPISCCNTVYKCITKLLAARLKKTLPSLINVAQAAFIPGRHISDNILLAQELVRGYDSSSSSPRCAFKVDLMKAFDSVRWDFLWDCLALFGFPAKFIGWVRACVSSPSYSLSLNGELKGFFAGRRGLRQGDPISPYLFVLCMEVFSRILETFIRSSPSFSYHWRCRKTLLSHLCFADDLMVFCKGDVPSVRVFHEALLTFSQLSGLTPNLEKSAVFFSGVLPSIQCEILAMVGFASGSLPVRYLGVPLITKRLGAADCQVLVDRILQRVRSWTTRFLSFGGRLLLIQSVLFGIQAFWSYHFILPARVLHSVERLLAGFLWTGSALSGRGARVSWDDVSKPKKEGGLGLKKLKDWNAAALSRLIWNLCQPISSSLWVCWVRANLTKKGQFWVAKVPWRCSWTWRKVLAFRDRLRSCISVKVGDGSSTSLWFDSWLPRGPICLSVSERVIYDSGLGADATVSDILSPGWSWPLANSPELIALKEETASMAVPPVGRRDRVQWLSSSAPFSIKSAWNHLRSSSPLVPWASVVWFRHHSPRHACLLWMAIRRRLPTLDRLLLFGISIPGGCRLCQAPVETHDHLFFSCPFAQRVWLALLTHCGLSCVSLSWSAFISWAVSSFSGNSLQFLLARLSLAACVYYLWQERNARRHGRGARTAAQIVNLVMDSVRARASLHHGWPPTRLNSHLQHVWRLL